MIKGLKSLLPKASLVVAFMFVFLLALVLLKSSFNVEGGYDLGILSEVSAQNGGRDDSGNQSSGQTATGDSVLCTIFPFLRGIAFAGNLCGGNSGAANAVGLGVTLVQTALSLVFVGIIAVAVYTIIRAALKYIRAEGDDSKVEEAQKSIKRVFIGIGALLVGVVGLAIVIALFGASESLSPTNGLNPQDLQNCLETSGATIEDCTNQLTPQ